MREKKPLEIEYELIAKEAINCINSIVLKGFTQLAKDSKNINAQGLLLRKAVKDLRTLASQNDLLSDLARIDSNNVIHDFEKLIESYKKYSLGNCNELAFLTLDYFITNYPSIPIELYMIKNGDHVFTVIGRNPHSNPSRVETWGDNAYFCDAWAGKVYKAIYYKKELRNYQLSRCGLKHYVEELRPEHTLALISRWDRYELIIRESDDYLRQVKTLFNLKLNILYESLQNLQLDLNKLLKDFSKDEAQYKIIFEKISEINKIIKHITTEFTNPANSTEFIEEEKFFGHNKKIKHELKVKLMTIIASISKMSQISTEDAEILREAKPKTYILFTEKTAVFKLKNAFITFNNQIHKLKNINKLMQTNKQYLAYKK